MTQNQVADLVVAPIAFAFLWWAFKWEAAVAWGLVQWYANLRFAKE